MPTTTSATITWTTDQAASTQVAYGTSLAYGSFSPLDPTRSTNHTVVLTGLTPGTDYFYQAISRNAAGIATVQAGTFSTGSGSGSFTVTWDTLGVPSSSQVEYGLTTSYGSITPLDPARVINHSVTVTGLTAGTLYFYRATSRNAAGIATQATGSFTTASATTAGTYGYGLYGDNTYGGATVSSSGAATGALIVGPINVAATGSNTALPATGALTVGPVLVVASGAAVIVSPPPPVSQGQPVPIVEVAFSSNPFLTPVWVDISRYVESFTISRGRNRELNAVQAGTLQLTMANLQRQFDPTYTDSPYYPYVLPGRKIRVRASWSGTIYSRFTGYIESWGQEWHGWQDATVTVTASDAFKPLNLAQLNTSFPVQSSDARISTVLDTIAWTIGGVQWVLDSPTQSLLGVSTVLGPTGDRSIGTGQTIVAASTLTNTSALQHMQDVATSELGLLFVNADGQVTFTGRNRTLLAHTNAATFGELELPYVDVTTAFDDTDLTNEVRVTGASGIAQVATDALSRSMFFLRTLAVTTILNSDVQALSLANLLLVRHKQPALQITSLTLDGWVNPTTIFPQIFSRELGDQVTVIRRPPAGGSAITQASLIQGINETYSAADGGEWRDVWWLQPVDTTVYWLLGDSTNSVLGVTTRLF